MTHLFCPPVVLLFPSGQGFQRVRQFYSQSFPTFSIGVFLKVQHMNEELCSYARFNDKRFAWLSVYLFKFFISTGGVQLRRVTVLIEYLVLTFSRTSGLLKFINWMF